MRVSLNIDNHSKTLIFKKFKHSLYKYYPKFVKAYKDQSNSSLNRLDIILISFKGELVTVLLVLFIV